MSENNSAINALVNKSVEIGLSPRGVGPVPATTKHTYPPNPDDWTELDFLMASQEGFSKMTALKMSAESQKEPVIYPVVEGKTPYVCPLTGFTHWVSPPAQKSTITVEKGEPEKLDIVPGKGIQIKAVSGHTFEMVDVPKEQPKKTWMGLGELGSPNTVFGRKIRKTIAILSEDGSETIFGPNFAKIEIDKTAHFVNGDKGEPNKDGTIFFTGKPVELQFTLYDVASDSPEAAKLFNWLAQVYQFTSGESKGEMKTFQAVVQTYDGVGNKRETWRMLDAQPTAISFGDLDYGSSETCEIQITLKYTKYLWSYEQPA